jgi:hypothetical protein
VEENEVGGAYSTNGEEENKYGLLVGKPEEKNSLEGPRHKWQDEIKKDNVEIELTDMDWICEASGTIKCWE